jgi:hypothetical protein
MSGVFTVDSLKGSVVEAAVTGVAADGLAGCTEGRLVTGADRGALTMACIAAREDGVVMS